MPTQLNHLIIAARNKQESAQFLAEMLKLDAPVEAGFFQVVKLDNHVTVDYADAAVDFPPQHYAFLVSDDVFDHAFARIRERGIEHWGPTRAVQGRGKSTRMTAGGAFTSLIRRAIS